MRLGRFRPRLQRLSVVGLMALVAVAALVFSRIRWPPDAHRAVAIVEEYARRKKPGFEWSIYHAEVVPYDRVEGILKDPRDEGPRRLWYVIMRPPPGYVRSASPVHFIVFDDASCTSIRHFGNVHDQIDVLLGHEPSSVYERALGERISRKIREREESKRSSREPRTQH
jgi:hypothetical protein